MSKITYAVVALLAPLVAVGAFSSYANAQSGTPGQWQMTVGAGARLQPSYEGSDRFSIAFRPIISFGRAGAVRWWSAEDDAISIGLVNGDNWRAGVGAALVMPRNSKDQRRLNGWRKCRLASKSADLASITPPLGCVHVSISGRP